MHFAGCVDLLGSALAMSRTDFDHPTGPMKNKALRAA
jgi:hypothetical protein